MPYRRLLQFVPPTHGACASLLLPVLMLLTSLLCATPVRAATVNVPAGTDLQTYLDGAQPGDTLVLQAGATYSGGFVLRYKGDGYTDYITITTSDAASLPGPGDRISPSQHSSLLPKIVSPGSNMPAIRTEPGAHHYRLIGIEIMPASASVELTNLVMLGDGSLLQDTLEEVPHHLTIDRCYIHAHPTQALRRGIALNSAATDILDSHISDFKSDFDAQAIWGWNGPGPFRIVNNYLEASGEVLGFGGTEPAITGLVPSDIEVRSNTLTKQLAWRGVWMCKNLFELKNAQRVWIEGNIMENNWADGQVGYAIVLTPGNGTALPSAVVQDITITNNIVRHSGAGINILGYGWVVGNTQASRQTNNLRITNNLFDDIDGARWGGPGNVLQLTATERVTFDHNTALHSGQVVLVYGDSCGQFAFTNNIARHNEYGIFGGGAGSGTRTIAQYFPDGDVRRNVLAGAPEDYYPPDNFYPLALDLADDYRLRADSLYLAAATDGKAVGCDFDALNAALANSSNSSMPTPTPTPTLKPTPITIPAGEAMWVEDALPAGATPGGDAEGWNWINVDPSPYSGTLSNQSNLVQGLHQQYFYGATDTMTLNVGDNLVAYVYLDPNNPPSQVMLQWNDGTWEHRAYWGANQIDWWGVDGTVSRRYMGDLPSAGQWVRLEVPASLVGLEGRAVSGMAFTLYGGRASWDHAGKSSN